MASEGDADEEKPDELSHGDPALERFAIVQWSRSLRGIDSSLDRRLCQPAKVVERGNDQKAIDGKTDFFAEPI